MSVRSSVFVTQFEGESYGNELGIAVPHELRARRVAGAPEPSAQACDQTLSTVRMLITPLMVRSHPPRAGLRTLPGMSRHTKRPRADRVRNAHGVIGLPSADGAAVSAVVSRVRAGLEVSAASTSQASIFSSLAPSSSASGESRGLLPLAISITSRARSWRVPTSMPSRSALRERISCAAFLVNVTNAMSLGLAIPVRTVSLAFSTMV